MITLCLSFLASDVYLHYAFSDELHQNALYGILFHMQNWLVLVFSYGFNSYVVADMLTIEHSRSKRFFTEGLAPPVTLKGRNVIDVTIHLLVILSALGMASHFSFLSGTVGQQMWFHRPALKAIEDPPRKFGTLAMQSAGIVRSLDLHDTNSTIPKTHSALPADDITETLGSHWSSSSMVVIAVGLYLLPFIATVVVQTPPGVQKQSLKPSRQRRERYVEFNKAGEIRIYIRNVATRLVKMGVLCDVHDLKCLPDEYWKFRNIPVEPGKKKRSPEFLADTRAAIQFAERFFRPEMWDNRKCPADMDIHAVCQSLLGPIGLPNHKCCFIPGDWIPPGSNFDPPIKAGVGKQTADYLMTHFFGVKEDHESVVRTHTSISSQSIPPLLHAMQHFKHLSRSQADSCKKNSADFLCCLMGNHLKAKEWTQFWRRHGSQCTDEALVGHSLEQWGRLTSDNWRNLWQACESSHCASSGIHFAVAFKPTHSSIDGKEQKDIEYELLDLRLARDMMHLSRAGKQAQEFTAFVRIIASTLVKEQLFASFRSLEELPAGFFSGRDKSRFCSSVPMACKFVEDMVTTDELVANDTFNPSKLIHCVRKAMLDMTVETEQEGSPQLPAITTAIGSGQIAALALLGHCGLKPHLLRRDIEVARHALLRTSMRALHSVTLEMTAVPAASMFLIVFECSNDCDGPDLFFSIATSDPGSYPVVQAMADDSISVRCGKFWADKYNRCMAFDVRMVKHPCEAATPARTLVHNTVKSEPAQFDSAGVVFVGLPSMVSHSSWEVLRVPALRAIMQVSNERPTSSSAHCFVKTESDSPDGAEPSQQTDVFADSQPHTLQSSPCNVATSSERMNCDPTGPHSAWDALRIAKSTSSFGQVNLTGAGSQCDEISTCLDYSPPTFQPQEAGLSADSRASDQSFSPPRSWESSSSTDFDCGMLDSTSDLVGMLDSTNDLVGMWNNTNDMFGVLDNTNDMFDDSLGMIHHSITYQRYDSQPQADYAPQQQRTCGTQEPENLASRAYNKWSNLDEMWNRAASIWYAQSTFGREY
jgi:hypothetical protein